MSSSSKKQLKIKLSRISILHYLKLVFRSILFLAATVIYIINRLRHTGAMFGGFERSAPILGVIWIVFAVEMFLRFFPSNLESMGCQKQFARNYIPVTEPVEAHVTSTKSIIAVVIAWIALNGIIGALYFTGIIDKGILLLISLAYSVCDMICILFFCPFQTWFMKNKCCGSCRIYNWDYAMMFTPFIFVKSFFTTSLLIMAIALLITWEVFAYRHPERFYETTNQVLSCANCQEKLCSHKKQLRRFLRRQHEYLIKRTSAGDKN